MAAIDGFFNAPKTVRDLFKKLLFVTEEDIEEVFAQEPVSMDAIVCSYDKIKSIRDGARQHYTQKG